MVTMMVAVVMMAVRMTAKQEETAAIVAIVDRLNLTALDECDIDFAAPASAVTGAA